MQKLYEILLPLTTNAGQPTDLARTAFLNDCRVLAKGYSILPMISGAWENEEGEIIFDRSIPVRVAAEEKTWAKLVRLAHKHFSDQECLLSFCVSDAPEFTYPSETDQLYGELRGIKESVPLQQVDLSQFNYGRALGAPKDGDAAKTYQHIADFAHCLSSVANQLSMAAWKLDMACQDVRTCETETEREAYTERALRICNATDVALEKLESKSGHMRVKFHRYGRAFRSAKGV